MKKWMLSFVMIFSGVTFAKEIPSSVLNYYQHRIQNRTERAPIQTLLGSLTTPAGVRIMATNCIPPSTGPSCVSTACNQGGFNCHFQGDLREVMTLCHNVDGACINDICGEGGFNCHFSGDLKEVIGLCAGVNGDCVEGACNEGGYNCHFSGDLKQVAQLCIGVEPNCVHDTCSIGGFNCHFAGDLQQVLTLCKP